jgi:tetratricopeptide (TPR) repeat protein
MKYTNYILFVVAAAVVIAGFFILRPHTASAPQTAATNTASSTTVDLGGGVTAQLPTGATITVVPNNAISQPNLNLTVVYASSLPADAVAALKIDIASTTQMLKKNPLQGDQWLQLAVDYKIAGDYSAAAAIWNYMTQVSPTSYIAFADLGDLYQNFVVNYPKAEANYLQAVKLAPTDIELYQNLYNLYRYQYKTNTAAAANIIALGLKNNPGNADLLALQAQFNSGK